MEDLYPMLYRSNKKRQVLFHMNESVIQRLDEVGFAFGISRSELIRSAVIQFLERELPVAAKATRLKFTQESPK